MAEEEEAGSAPSRGGGAGGRSGTQPASHPHEREEVGMELGLGLEEF
jgi:hypothetical protein